MSQIKKIAFFDYKQYDEEVFERVNKVYGLDKEMKNEVKLK